MSSDLRTALQRTLGTAYTIERDLGGGGMSRVFVARDEELGRSVVVKVLDPELSHSVSAERFAREIRLAASLQEPHIVPVLSAGLTDNGLPYYTMPFVRGESLRRRLEQGPLPVDECLSILRDIAKALAYAHREGVIHRDIKPENILLSEGTAVVTDFGIARALHLAADSARVTGTGVSLGTPAYMAPEQVAGDPLLDHRADLYSLGLVAYEMLAARHPFAGATAQALLAAQVMERPKPLAELRQDLLPGLAATVMRLLEKAPENRPQSAQDLLRELSSTTLPPPAPVERSDRVASIGVLPFSNVADDSETEYFSDGMTEELIYALAKVDGMRVAARTSSFATKGHALNARDIGTLLGVTTVLDGSVRRVGNRIRVTVHLVDAAAGVELWADRYDREMRDIFDLQDEIVRAIVGALRVRLTGAPGALYVAAQTRDLEAYELFLKGRFAWNQRTSTTVTEAVRYFEQAVSRDPAFARAHAGLADACLNLPMYTNTPPTTAWAKGKAAATTALALDPTLAEVHASLAYGTMLYEWDWARAEESFRRAIAADDEYPTAHHWYADFLAGRGRLEESLREMQRAHDLDPLSRVIGVELGWVHHLLGRYEEAVTQLEATLRLDPNFAHTHFGLGLAHAGAGAYGMAVSSLRKALELGGFYSFAHAALCFAYARLEDRDEAARLLDDLRTRSTNEYVPMYALAIAFTAVGDLEQALACLHRGVDERDVLLAENLFDPILDALRNEAEYRRLLDRMGLGDRQGVRGSLEA